MAVDTEEDILSRLNEPFIGLTDEEKIERLRWDTPAFAAFCSTIVDKRGRRVRLIPKPEQLRLDAELERQRDADLPMRAVILKARQIGFCLDPGTRVLTSDLRWKEISSLRPGDELVATDEDVPGRPGCGRRMRRGVVEAVRDVWEPAFRVRLDNGEEFTATGPHRFLCKRRGGVETQWRTVADLHVGDCIRHVCQPWDGQSYADGWMGGILDGEGCLRAKENGGVEVAVSQVDGDVYRRARDYFVSRGYTFHEDEDRRSPEGSTKYGSTPVLKLVLHRTNELFRLIGQTRPSRFLPRSEWWEGRELPGKRSGVGWAQVEAIEAVPKRHMIDLQTSTKTFIAEGFVSHNSTWSQCKLIQRTTQQPDHRALVLGQVNDTAGELFKIGERIWKGIPDDIPDFKPRMRYTRRQRYLEFDNDSWYRADNAKEFEAGRGLTLRSAHCSEVASYDDAQRKLTGLLEAVPDEPGTLVVLESTAKGQNYFKDLWDSAASGESGYVAFFSAWWHEASYSLSFANEPEQEDFSDSVGEGPLGEDEPGLVDLLLGEGFTEVDVLEKLHWRRRKILTNFKGDVDLFHQEYPSTPEEAFLTSGRHVFDIAAIRRMQARVRAGEEPTTGRLVAKGPLKSRVSRGVTVHYPTAVTFEESSVNDDRRPGWRVWAPPKLKTKEEPGGQYIIGVDASGGDEIEGTGAYHVIDVIDHRTRRQVAEYRSRIDPDELAIEILKAALWYGTGTGGMPWVAIEVTGSWGLPAAKRLHIDYRYALVYRRRRQASSKERYEDILGWHTGFEEKKLMLTELKEMLRCGEDGVMSRGLADEFGWYILDDRNRARPEYGKTADRLIAHGIAAVVAREKPLRPDRKPGDVSSTVDHSMLTRTGYLR